MRRGDIYLVTLDPSSGHEQRGTRPVLIVTSDAFNRVNKMPIIVPITSGGAFARNAGFAVPLDGSGTRTTGVALCNQLRVLDLESRNGRRLESLPEVIMREVLNRLLPLFEMP